MGKPDIREILEKMAPKPYFDWGNKQLGANGGYAKGFWDAGKESRERMFVFHKDVEFAKECLRRDYEEPTETNALLKLCGSRRTGNRRFPRFGWFFPQQGSIIGRREFLKHPGKTSAWQSLYALLAKAPIDSRLKKSILKKIDSMEKCDESKKRVFSESSPKFITTVMKGTGATRLILVAFIFPLQLTIISGCLSNSFQVRGCEIWLA